MYTSSSTGFGSPLPEWNECSAAKGFSADDCFSAMRAVSAERGLSCCGRTGAAGEEAACGREVGTGKGEEEGSWEVGVERDRWGESAEAGGAG